MKLIHLLVFILFFISTSAQNVGVGTSTPAAPLDVNSGNNWDLTNTEGDVRVGNNNYRLKMGVATGGGGAGAVGIMQYGQPGGFNVLSLGAQGNYILALNGTTSSAGIGTTAPTEKLDVNGNINLSGTIKVNGVDGTPDQVLMKNSSGNMAWMDISEFKNFKVFTNTSVTSWTVPAGVSKILVEAWGAGGGGGQAGGGASGNYFVARPTVVAGNSLNITCGSGGYGAIIGGNGIAENGGNTTVAVVSASPVTLTARGGGGGSYNAYGTVSYPTYPANVAIFHQQGEQGSANSETYAQYQAGVFVTTVNYGKGGDSPLVPNSGCKGGLLTYNTASPATWIKWIFPNGGGNLPGGGGAASPDIGSGYYGTYGGNGLVIVRW